MGVTSGAGVPGGPFSDGSVCVTCGTLFSREAGAPPARCPVCEDDRQYVPAGGQRWTTLAAMVGDGYRNAYAAVEPGLVGIETSPRFAIGQRALLVRTPDGNLLWDPVTFIDDLTCELVRGLGGIRAVAASHPHFFASMSEWARRFDARIHLHSSHRPWVACSTERVAFTDADRLPLFGGLTLVRTGGHFPGSSVLHKPDGAEGRGALLTGDTIQLVAHRQMVTFLHSYPNQIPLPAASVAHIAEAVLPLPFDRIYGGWGVMPSGAHQAVRQSAERYMRALRP